MHPDKMADAIGGVSTLLSVRVEFQHGDWRVTTLDATSADFVYMDPPYLGTTVGRDKRYHEQLASNTLVEGLEELLRRRIKFALSYDGMTGDKKYGPRLPAHLGLTRLLLNAGRSSQATLAGRAETTLESLYLSPCIAAATGETERVVERPRQVALSL
ncbi:DNA adenine methylase [Xylella fastidiosa]|uniref:DNA adenine methylase n=1 Tax=Xylella fastidiosa TaxID=2371 RepID=UPI001D18042A|nr:DNA adenine methylase [Xylella fastidiosa]MCP8324229.1 DNA adenine methylase [Xylella fastidiosa subsp. multiplex]